MSWGTGPFGSTGLGVPIAELPSEPHTTLSSSRSIDFPTMRYVQNTDGGFKGMSDTLQRVLLAIAFGVREPKIITPQALRQVENDVRISLEPLTKQPNPAIKLISVSAADDGKQTTTKTVVFYDYSLGKQQEVKAN